MLEKGGWMVFSFAGYEDALVMKNSDV